MNTPAILTLGKAAKLLGRSKPTVSDWIEKGDLPAGKNDKGHYQIQLADLQTLYPDLLREQELKLEANSKETGKTSQPLTPQNADELALIKGLLSKLEDYHQKVADEKDARISDLTIQLAETKSLTDQRSPEEKARDAKAVAEAQQLQEQLKQAKIDIDLTPKPVKTLRRLTLWERLKGRAEVMEIEEQVEVA